MIEDKAIAYLSRLTGSPVTRNQTVVLNSLHRAAFSAWLSKESAPSSFLEAIARPFTVEGLFNSSQKELISSAPASKEPNAPAFAREVRGAIFGIGIDIENCKTLPEVSDYRAHEFYTANFSSAEIAYCILQPSTCTSLTGLWAAKEAIVKSGAVRTSAGGLRDVEILHDGVGRPSFPGCLLSISHTEQAAIAVAVWLGPALSDPSNALHANNSGLTNDNIEDTGQKNIQPRRRTINITVALFALVAAPLLVWMTNHFKF